MRNSAGVQITVPDWIDHAVDWNGVSPTDEAKMRVAIELAMENVRRQTGGPFGAAIFDARTHRLVSVGVNSLRGTANAPTVFNSGFNSAQFWDGRAATLEEQAAGPITNPVEMNLPLEECVKRLNADGNYPLLFDREGKPKPAVDAIIKAAK